MMGVALIFLSRLGNGQSVDPLNCGANSNRAECCQISQEDEAMNRKHGKKAVNEFTRQHGRLPLGWPELISTGLLRRVPADPKNIRGQRFC
jgi:hypothetical protein